MNIVVLDGYTLNPGDLDWQPIRERGECIIYNRTSLENRRQRAQDADILVVNKVPIDRDLVSSLPRLKYICVAATGYNNLDINALKQYQVLASNVRSYSTQSMAQHVFASLLAVINKTYIYHKEVKKGAWSKCPDFSYWHEPICELSEKNMGIFGFGQTGREVAKIALAFGMNVYAHHKHPEDDVNPDVEFVELEELFSRSDVLSLHIPLTPETKHIVDKRLLYLMPRDAILVNCARGALICENDLYEHLKNKKIRAACLDVLETEPPPGDHPFFGLSDCYITPHQAWASRESRQRLLNNIADNIEHFQAGNPKNLIV